MKPKVYIETTVVSYFTGFLTRDLIVAARQEITGECWPKIAMEFEQYISVLVVQEAEGGDPEAAARRLDALQGIPVLQIDSAAEDLAQHLISDGAIPKEHTEDALHIALAVTNGMDYLLTWNFAHINNAQMETKIRQIVEKYGYQYPTICSPEELMGD